jgi:hypothetical protein
VSYADGCSADTGFFLLGVLVLELPPSAVRTFSLRYKICV